MGGDTISILVDINSIVKLSNTSYHSLCTSDTFNIPTASFNPCFDCDALSHGVGSFPHKKDQKKISEKKKKFIKMKQIQGGSGGCKMWVKLSNKKGWANKVQNQHQSYKKSNGNGYTKSKI